MSEVMKYGVIGSGSWATALVKILTDNGNEINWWVRNDKQGEYIRRRRHNPQYLPTAYLNVSKLTVVLDVNEVVAASDVLVLAVPSAYIKEVLAQVDKESLKGKKIVSAMKGIVPGPDILLNEYLEQEFAVPLENYFAVLGPCHAEEVASEKLS